MRRVGALASLLFFGCAPAQTDSPGSRSAPWVGAQGPTRAALEGQRVAPLVTTEAPTHLRLTPLDRDRGENGSGQVVAAHRPVAIDLVNENGWPGRARDPTLHIGQLVFVHYEHPAIDVMRFVVADRQLLPVGMPVVLRYGDDPRSTRTAVEPVPAVLP